MKLVRYGEPRRERPGLIDDEGRIRDLSSAIEDVSPETLSPNSLMAIATISTARSLPIVSQPVRLGPCIANPSKIICIGLNYHKHIAEIGAAVPTEPIIFMKAPSALSGGFDDIVIPRDASAVDWEIELGVVIGSRATRIAPEDSLSHIAGYCVVNDISERDWQLRGTGQWVKGKSADTFAPVGPWLVTTDEIPDPQALELRLSVNGETQQCGNTSDMVFGVAQLVSYVSKFMTLLPGDIISTGTPPGVGMGQHPPRYLQSGDVVELMIEGLGMQTQRACKSSA
jgi:2,4-didehydro-3-deoxy-L-rhamnonate hydrolase